MKYLVIILLIISSCVYHKTNLPFKGSMLITYSGRVPEKSIFTEYVISHYYNNAEMVFTTTKSSNSIQPIIKKELKLIRGSGSVLVIYGHYSPNNMFTVDAIAHTYLLCVEFDIDLMYPVKIGGGSTKAFLYHGVTGFLNCSSKGTTDLIGYLTIDNLLNDTLTGHLNIEANLYQFSSTNTEATGNENNDCINLNIIFRAEKQDISNGAKVLLRFLVPTDTETDF